MAKAVSKRVEGKPKASPQLLDTKSDYNNYSNLSYFISQYKRAVEIINECETFYSNFLRNKLLSYDQIKETPGINLLNFKFHYDEYQKNIGNLYKYFVYKTLSKEFNEAGLILYQCKPCKTDSYGHVGEVIESEYIGDFTISSKKGALIVDPDYKKFLLDGYCFHRYKMEFKKKDEHYSWGDSFIDKIVVKQAEGTYGSDKHNVPGFVFTGKTTGKLATGDGKERHFKVVHLERVRHDYNWKTKKTKYIPLGDVDIFAYFEEEEKKLINVLKEFSDKYGDIQYDMYTNPSKYIELWKEYTEKYILSKKSEKVDENTADLGKVNEVVKAKEPGEYYVHTVHESDFNRHRGMLAPVDYTLGPTGLKSRLFPEKFKGEKPTRRSRVHTSRVNGHVIVEDDEPQDEYIDGTYSIDAVNFLNFKNIRSKTKKDNLSNVLSSARMRRQQKSYSYYSEEESAERTYLRQAKLQQHIEKIHTEAVNAAQLNIDMLINKNWYYVLIDNTPYQFTDHLYDVKIEYDEEENMLHCDYDHETRRKKAPWPGWLPWVVTEHSYRLVFDCKTNEPIDYWYDYSEHEEKIGD